MCSGRLASQPLLHAGMQGEQAGLSKELTHLKHPCPHLLRVAQALHVDRLHLVVPRPDDLAAGVHGGHRLLAPKLYHDAALVVAEGQGGRGCGGEGRRSAMGGWCATRGKEGRQASAGTCMAAMGSPALQGRLCAVRAGPVAPGGRRPCALVPGPLPAGACPAPTQQQLHAPQRAGPRAGSPDGNGVGALDIGHRPHALHAIVERILQPVGGGVPQLHSAVLRAREDEGQLRVEAHGGDVVRVAVQRLRGAGRGGAGQAGKGCTAALHCARNARHARSPGTLMVCRRHPHAQAPFVLWSSMHAARGWRPYAAGHPSPSGPADPPGCTPWSGSPTP